MAKPPPERPQAGKAAATGWADVKRGFRFGVGFLLAVATILFAFAAIFFVMGRHEWVGRVMAWLERLGF